MSKNINPDVKRMLSERIAHERKLSEKSKVGYDAKRKTQALVAGTLIATTLSSGITPAFADSRYEDSDYKGVGYISVTEEVGPQGDGAMISSGKGDAGGVSYGLTQLSSVVGSADEFVDNYLNKNYPEFYKFFENADKAGTKSFNEAWTNAYNHNPGEFERIQLENKEVNYVNPSYENVKEQFGIDLLSTRARTEFLHSTSVQFGPEGVVQLIENSGVTKEMDDEELLSKLSDEKYKSVGTYKFLKCSGDVQDSVRQRFKREKEEYIKIAKEEKGPLLEDEIDESFMESESSVEEFVETAKSYLNQGTTYKMGGKNTDKLDCSGYVSLVYQDMGIDINEMMTNAGKFRNDSTKISRDELKEGDLVFWHDKTGTKHAPVFHIGIYIGDDTVVDCSPDHKGVGTRKLSSLQDNSERYYTFGRYEELQEKITSTDSDLFLDLSDVDEFESEIEISESVEEKFEDEVSEDTTEIEEDESVIDDEVVEENTVEEDESIVDEEAIEDETTDEDESVIDDEVIEEDIIEEDESIIDEEAVEEDTTVDEDESVIDDEVIEDDTIEEDTIVEEDESIIDDSELEDNEETEIEEDESTVDNEEVQDEETQEDKDTEDTQENEENETEEDNSTIDDDKEDDTVEEDKDDTDTEKENSESTVEDNESDNEKDDLSTDNESDNDKVDVDENTDTDEESKSETEDTTSNEDTTSDNDSETDSKEDLNTNSFTDEVEKEENTSTDMEDDNNEEPVKENSSTDDNTTLENNSTDIDVDNNVESETVVAMSASEAKIQELEKKLENNLFANLFRS